MSPVPRHDAHVVDGRHVLLCDTASMTRIRASDARQLVVEQGCMLFRKLGNVY